MSDTLSFTQLIQAPPAAVYAAFTNQAMLTYWLCNNAQITLKKGGPLFLEWTAESYYAVGEFTDLKPDQLLAFTWRGRGEPDATVVRVALSATPEGTQVTLTHSGLGVGSAWDDMRAGVQEGWASGLANLKTVLETGLDDRYYRRPFLGIYLAGTISAEEAAVLRLPIAGGIRINGAAPDTGAAEAGLQTGDILLALDEAPLTDYTALRASLGNHRAGDVVNLRLFRDGAAQTQPMRLSQRAILEIPDTPTALADAVRQRYDELDAQLDALVADVSEADAIFQAAPDQWSAKDILAHLITAERGLQMAAASSCDHQILLGWPDNPAAWNAALTGTYAFAQMVQVWKQAESESVSMLRALPDDLVARKVEYRGMAERFLHHFPNHTREHLGEMRAAITAARQTSSV